jgi:ubiquinone/menaquinone biosynthesis C-methylase UbiE
MEITAKDYDDAYFKSLIEAYEKKTPWSENRTSRIDAIEVKGKCVLDLGCGMGTFAMEAEKKGAFVIGSDYSRDALRSARKLKNDLKVFQCDSQKLPFRDAVFDCVLMMDFVEHLYPQQYVKTCGEVDRVLKPAGEVLIYTPKPHSRVIPQFLINLYNKYIIKIDYYDKTHVGEKTPEEILQEFSSYSSDVFLLGPDEKELHGVRKTLKNLLRGYQLIKLKKKTEKHG